MSAELILTNEDCGVLLTAAPLTEREFAEAFVRTAMRALEDVQHSMVVDSLLVFLNDHAAPEGCKFELNEDGLFFDHDFACTLCADGVPYPHDFQIEEDAA